MAAGTSTSAPEDARPTPLAALAVRQAPASSFQRRLLKQSGDGCRDFLQMQGTADIEAIERAGRCEQTAFCDRKGTVRADAWVVPPQACLPGLGPQGEAAPPAWLLLADAGVLPPLLELLQPHARLAGVELAPLPGWTFAFQNAGASRHGPDKAIALGAGRQAWICPQASRRQPPEAYSKATRAWDAWLVDGGRVAVCKATSARFRPHELGYQHTPAVSFAKGCYPGQEVIARTEHLGKLKRACGGWRPQAGTAAPEVGESLEMAEGGRLTVLARCLGEPLRVLALAPRDCGEQLRLQSGALWRRIPMHGEADA